MQFFKEQLLSHILVLKQKKLSSPNFICDKEH